jgi:DNA-directed RNA polymerase specialized sigma24 family protein
VGKAKKNGRVIVSRGAYATPADFKRVFTEDVNSLYLLSLLLTGSPEKAERCFVEGIGEATKGNYVFKEWARSWARRTIILSAIRLIAPMDNCETIGWNADLARGMNKIPMILHSEVRAILDLAPLERFAFVMSVLERYSDNDCSILLGCARAEIVRIRARAMQQLGRSSDPAASSSDHARYANTAMITTPLIAQYFSPSVWAEAVSGQ